MKAKITIAALLLAFTPGLAAAMCGKERLETTAQCGEGMIWDARTGTCIKPVHS
ncbi:MAG: hypothetical protein ACK4KW_01735 [Gemmobacter sp.]